MISPSLTRTMRPLRRRMLAIATATAAGLMFAMPGVASADSTTSTTTTATPIVVSAPATGVVAPDSDSWSTPAITDGAGVVFQDDSDSWS